MIILPGYEQYIKQSLINKGWSDDKKYLIKTADGHKLLLKTACLNDYTKKKAEFEAVIEISKLGIPMMMPEAFGRIESLEIVYMLFSWIEGEEAENILPLISKKEQYDLGYESGKILKKIHSIDAPSDQQDWSERFNKKIDRNISRYLSCGIKVPFEEKIIDYINENRKYLIGRPQSIQHGDYHVGNIFIAPENKLGIIDFNRWDYGDPWEEFNRIVWSVHSSEIFASAQLDGYFGDNIPDIFFRLMALYIASNAIASIPWAIPYGESDVNAMLRNIDEMIEYYSGFETFIPSWFK